MNVKQLKKSCELGDKRACKTLYQLQLDAAADVELDGVEDDSEHPNQLPFTGTLLTLDQPSTKPPHGSRGHKILVSKAAAKRNLKSLIGMGVNYDPGHLEAHAPRHKVGVITGAWIDGNKVKVRGWIYKKDFPEAERDLKAKGLGMSMELANVYVENENADVWNLEDFKFTGATILYKDAAAYYNTSLAAKAAAEGDEGAAMAEETKKKTEEVAAAGSGITLDALTQALTAAVAPLAQAIQAQGDSITQLAKHVDDMGGVMVQAAAGSTDVDEEEEEVEVNAAKEELDSLTSEEDEEDFEEEDEEEIEGEAQLGPEKKQQDSGEVNDGMEKNKGAKTTTTEVGASSLAAAAAQLRAANQNIRQLTKRITRIEAAHADEVKKLKTRIRKMDMQLEAAADATSRRSAAIPVDLQNLAAKANVNLAEVANQGIKMTTEQVDSMFAAAGFELDPVQRMTMKNRLVEMNLMEQGEVRR